MFQKLTGHFHSLTKSSNLYSILYSQTEMTVFKFDSLASNWIYILAEFKFDGVAAQKSCDIFKSVKAMYAVTQFGYDTSQP